MEEKIYRFWLHRLPGVGDRSIEKLLAVFGSAENVCRAGKELEKVLGKRAAEEIVEFNTTFDAPGAYEQMLRQKIAFYTPQDPQYPARLKRLARAPYGLYCLGALPQEGRPAAAVIGARECSGYGRFVAEAFGGGLSEAGVSIISGMARGIDGLAQQAALAHGGGTWAILGCGVDVCYPACNRTLYQEILEKGGGILSVFPPGTPPARGRFPERNRIVAGLSDLVLVVEARQKSGTLITVDMALEQGKHVYAVPGRLTDRLSDGCNLLIRQGAGIALAPSDLLAELRILDNRKALGGGRKEPAGEPPAPPQSGEGDSREGTGEGEELLKFLDCDPKSADDILRAVQGAGISMELPELLAELIGLCMEGKAARQGGSYFFRADGSDLFAEQPGIGYNEKRQSPATE